MSVQIKVVAQKLAKAAAEKGTDTLIDYGLK
jgi:hypothetical protein